MPSRLATAQPAYPSEIDWGHPLTNQLSDAFVFNAFAGNPTSLVWRDTATAVAGNSLPFPKWQRDGYGGSRNFSNDTTKGELDRFADRPQRSITGALSIATAVVSTSTGANQWHEIVARRASTANSAIEYAVNFNAASGVSWPIQLFWNTGSAYQVVTSTGGAQGGGIWHIGASRSSGNVGKVYKNGALLFTSGALSAAAAGSTPLTFGACNDGSEPMDGRIYYCYIWSRELTANDIAWVAAEPYTFVVARKHRAYSIPAAGAGPAGHGFTSAFIIG